ncbi:MAG: hypothetical protein ACI8RZ_007826 [Myxococcota bacterium]|jgi:hypothetical protein
MSVRVCFMSAAVVSSADTPGEQAILPGVATGTLLGRVGDTVFVLGRSGEVPEGLEGPLLLSINVNPAPVGFDGSYTVEIALQIGL